ncbi:BTB/POZ domain-containing protein 18-like isoform X2 [Cheilinus undulatus]|uniref:BTB/POZ domain-containing protein 18-like isoform X2 n=1 Tax=Cheilinus undulatus TaxID=241271 RepID=UPI001BD544EA|nr:BTB/POZ domain-containing protein 18-like isoform X2 [Cheilinus undulatus]
MQKYHWPGFKRQLLAELQKQQNSAQFCDTLLQTEGISVPAHSCILAALSPYLSRKLSASASPPSGQKHQLQLQALKAQTLLKLVGLLYSGELEVERSEEKNDILSAACQFGITNLVGDQKDTEAMEKEPQDEGLHCCRDIEEGGCERNKIRKMQDAQVQSDISMGRTEETLTEERSCVSVGTQTVVTDEQADSSFSFSTQSIDSPQEPTSSLFRSTSQTQNTTLEQDFSSASCPPIPGMSVEASSDGASILHQSSDSVTNSTSTSALSNHRMASSSSPYDRLDSPTPHVYGTYQQSSERIRNGKMADSSENTGQQKLHSHRNIMMGAGKDMAKEKMQDHENAGMRSLAKTKHMQQVMEDTQISIKVKLRRRTKGETWEVVNIQNADDTLAVLTSLQEDVSNQKRQQTALTSGTPPLSSVQMDSITTPHTPALQPATTSFTEPTPLHNNTTSDSQTLSSDCFSPNQNDSLEPASVAQTQGPVEDSDEQIEKLLEDIMMGLNILPNLERDPKKSHRLQTSTDQAAATCQIVQTENGGTENGGTEIQMHSGIGAAGCGCYQEFGTQIVISSTEAGIHGCFAQPSCSSLSSSTQQQQCSPQYHCSVTSMGQKDGLNHLGQACDEAVTDRKQTIDNDGFFGDDSYLPQEGNNMPPDYNLKPQTPKTNGPPPLDADDCQKISGCFPTKEDEGDDDEVEVDVLLFSPDKVPRTRYRETGAEHTDMVLEEEEEEEEDGNEIDVTGDEAE